jgi:hypothetical protein
MRFTTGSSKWRRFSAMSARKPPRNGKLGSPSADKPSPIPAVSPKLRKLLDAVYPEYQRLDDLRADTTCRWDFVFHMTDWEGDLERLANLYKHPEQFSKAEAEKIVSGFLYHATAHIMEAARLLLDYEPGYIFDSPKPLKGTNRKRKASAAV